MRWATREEVVTDALEADVWRALLSRGARFAYCGAVTCHWVDHPDQQHKIIGWGRIDNAPGAVRGAAGRGRAAYRAYYGVGRQTSLNWRPTMGAPFDERYAYAGLSAPRDLPAPGGLRILLAGELGFNPERILAFEERGHTLSGLWVRHPEFWDAAGPFPFGNIEEIPFRGDWKERVRAARPDVIYALLNWQALPLIEAVLDAGLDIPLVFHFKEGPHFCQTYGLWPALQRALTESEGQVLLSPESLEYLSRATPGGLDPARVLLLDGDLPLGAWMTDDWQPRLSAADGELHTVCCGRLMLDLETFDALVRAGVHLHLYGEQFHEDIRAWSKPGLDSGYLHLHPTVYPRDWVRELSRYDAAWMHVFRSANGGDMGQASWDDLNLPARIGAYAAAGLPWIMRDNGDACVATQRLAARYDVGVPFTTVQDLVQQLRDGPRLAALTASMRAARRVRLRHPRGPARRLLPGSAASRDQQRGYAPESVDRAARGPWGAGRPEEHAGARVPPLGTAARAARREPPRQRVSAQGEPDPARQRRRPQALAACPAAPRSRRGQGLQAPWRPPACGARSPAHNRAPRAVRRPRVTGPRTGALFTPGRARLPGLQLQEGALGVYPADVLADAAVAVHHAVAGHHHRQGVGGAGRPHGAHRPGAAGGGGDGGVAGRLPVPDPGQVGEDGAPEAVRQPEVEGQIEARAPAGEVLLQLPGGPVQAGGGPQHTRADAGGEAGQDGVVVLAGVGHPDEPLFGGGQEQRPHRGVQRAVGDVQDSGPRRLRDEALVEPALGFGVHVGQGGEEVAGGGGLAGQGGLGGLWRGHQRASPSGSE